MQKSEWQHFIRNQDQCPGILFDLFAGSYFSE